MPEYTPGELALTESGKEFEENISQLEANAEIYARALTETETAEHSDAVENKIGVCETLGARLKGNDAFTNLTFALKQEGYGLVDNDLSPESGVRAMLNSWAVSSGDTSHIAIAFQMAVRDEFGLEDVHIPGEEESMLSDTEEFSESIKSARLAHRLATDFYKNRRARIEGICKSPV